MGRIRTLRSPDRWGALAVVALLLSVSGAVGAAAAPAGASATARSALHVAVAISNFSAEPATMVLGNRSVLTVSASGGTGPLSYEYSSLPPGCPGSNASAIDCRPTASGRYDLRVLVIDAAGNTASASAPLNVTAVGAGGAGPVISAFGATPDPVLVGSSVAIEVNASEGSSALTYAYPELPSGCASANRSALSCTPTGNGTAPLYVLVRDPAGRTTGAVAYLTIVPPLPSIESFSAAPEHLHLGDSTSLSANVTGGAAPLVYAYSDLPKGCSGDDAPSIICTPGLAGNYTIGLSVVDALGRHANATARLEVLPASTGSSGPPGPGPASWYGLYSKPGLATLAFLAGATVALAGIEVSLRRRRRRAEGLALVRELVAAPAPAPDPADLAPSTGREG